MDADAIVIGAGVAGLTAARALARWGYHVIVLEARERIGGRAWTCPVPGLDSIGELGAEFIHGRAIQTMALLHEAKITTAGIGDEAWITNDRGGLERDEVDFSSTAKVFEAAYALPQDESVEQFLQCYAEDPLMRARAENARTFVEGFDAADPAIASARAIADEWRSGTDTASARPVGGYGSMIAYLQAASDAAGARTRLSSRVQRVAWQRGTVAVDVIDARGGVQTIRARSAIVTLPVGVLRHRGGDAVIFDPPLPRSKERSLAFIEMGHAVRVVLGFRTPFWERVNEGRYRNAGFFRGPGPRFRTFWTQVPQRSRSIVAWLGGPEALAMADISATEVIAGAIDGFGALFEDTALAREQCEGGIVHNWSRDPFAHGAYSYVRVGGADARATLAAPLDETLFFAGEATSTDGQGGTVNGALETGERAAAQAAAALDMKAH